MRQVDIANVCNMSQSTFSRIERGGQKANVVQRQDICYVLDMEPVCLVYFSGTSEVDAAKKFLRFYSTNWNTEGAGARVNLAKEIAILSLEYPNTYESVLDLTGQDQTDWRKFWDSQQRLLEKQDNPFIPSS